MLPIELINWLVMSFLQHTFREKEDIFPHPLSLSFSYCFFVITDCSVVLSSFIHIHTQSNRYAKHFYKAIIFFAKESKCVTRGTNVFFSSTPFSSFSSSFFTTFSFVFWSVMRLYFFLQVSVRLFPVPSNKMSASLRIFWASSQPIYNFFVGRLLLQHKRLYPLPTHKEKTCYIFSQKVEQKMVVIVSQSLIPSLFFWGLW